MLLSPLLAVAVAAVVASERDPPPPAVREFLAAADPRQARKKIKNVLRSDIDFAALWDWLEAGREYSADVETGRLELTRRAEGLEYRYVVLVPEDYDPTRRYPVHVYLHGGVARTAVKPGGRWWRNYERVQSPDRISVFPASWADAMWWQARQVRSVEAILDSLRRRYNIDEQRVHLIGVSDGATGAWYLAMRSPTPWASFVPLIGSPGVFANPTAGVEGELYAANLAGRPFYVVNGGNDPLYPPPLVVPYLQLFQRAGAEVTFQVKPDAGHDLRWWPDEAAPIDAFIRSHPRDPFPGRVVWETASADHANRAYWVVVDELGRAAGEAELSELNDVSFPSPPGLGFHLDHAELRVLRVEPGSLADASGVAAGDRIVEVNGQPVAAHRDLYHALRGLTWGSRFDLVAERDGERRAATASLPAGPPPPLTEVAFPRTKDSGRIEVERRGNDIVVKTRGVRRYRLLLSPEQVDFDRPVTVTTNGVTSFQGTLQRDPEALLEWAARDNDRTMLYGAELEIDLGR